MNDNQQQIVMIETMSILLTIGYAYQTGDLIVAPNAAHRTEVEAALGKMALLVTQVKEKQHE